MSEPRGAEKDEAIARWMGWRWFSETTDESRTGPDFPVVPDERSRIGRRAAPIPAYGESLDALVPVMEALRDAGYRMNFWEAEGRWGAGVYSWIPHEADLLMREAWADKPAEALRDAIYAALVTMNYVEKTE